MKNMKTSKKGESKIIGDALQTIEKTEKHLIEIAQEKAEIKKICEKYLPSHTNNRKARLNDPLIIKRTVNAFIESIRQFHEGFKCSVENENDYSLYVLALVLNERLSIEENKRAKQHLEDSPLYHKIRNYIINERSADDVFN